jgi:hypothetical protein
MDFSALRGRFVHVSRRARSMASMAQNAGAHKYFDMPAQLASYGSDSEFECLQDQTILL